MAQAPPALSSCPAMRQAELFKCLDLQRLLQNLPWFACAKHATNGKLGSLGRREVVSSQMQSEGKWNSF